MDIQLTPKGLPFILWYIYFVSELETAHSYDKLDDTRELPAQGSIFIVQTKMDPMLQWKKINEHI